MAKIHNFFGSSTEAEDMRCAECGLSQQCKSANVSYVGRGEKSILIVIDSVDNFVDKSGSLTEGKTYKFLNTELRKYGIDLYQDCWVTPCVRCNLEGNPTKKHVMTCNFQLMEEIKELKPKFIWTFGNLALSSITDKYYSGIQDTHANGDVIPITEFRAYLTPLQAVFIIQSAKKDENFQSEVRRNIKKAWKFARSNPKFKTYNYTNSKNVEFLLEFQEVIDAIDKLIAQGGEQAFDFETTGLKPHKSGHKIPTMAIADDHKSYASRLIIRPIGQKMTGNKSQIRLQNILGVELSRTLPITNCLRIFGQITCLIAKSKSRFAPWQPSTFWIIEKERRVSSIRYSVVGAYMDTTN